MSLEKKEYILFPRQEYLDVDFSEKDWQTLKREMIEYLKKFPHSNPPYFNQVAQHQPQEYYNGAIKQLLDVLFLFREEYAAGDKIQVPGHILKLKLDEIYQRLMALLAVRENRQSIFAEIR